MLFRAFRPSPGPPQPPTDPPGGWHHEYRVPLDDEAARTSALRLALALAALVVPACFAVRELSLLTVTLAATALLWGAVVCLGMAGLGVLCDHAKKRIEGRLSGAASFV